MCCGISCFEASTDSDCGIQVEDQVCITEMSSMSNMTKKKLKVMKSSRLNKNIIILKAEKVNCMVM
jgi:hypothetical protein